MVAGRKFVTLEVDYTTASGIQKTLKLAHSDAEAICKHVQEELSVMPRGARHASFWASFRRNR